VRFELRDWTAEQIESTPLSVLAEGAWDEPEFVKVSVRPKGSFMKLGEETEDDVFWAELYDGRFGHVYFGHDPRPKEEHPVEYDYATALDLGAVFGGRLAAVVLEPGAVPGWQHEYFTVESSGKYAELVIED
jgi:hypothetical protein